VKELTYIIKGIVIGIAMLVPGVSGGTMAIILGLYNEMICAVSSFFSNVKKNISFLGFLAIGGLIGVFGFSKLIEYSLNNFKVPVLYLFLGIILGGIPILYKQASAGNKTKKDWFYFISGFIIVVIMAYYNGTIVNLASSTGILNFMFLILAGIIIAVALILPGISTSFMLLVLGLYDITLKAINEFRFNYLIPIIIGVGIGVIATTKLLEKFLTNNPRQTYMLILGFVAGSIIEVFPGIPMGFDLVVSTITLVIGFVCIRYISQKYKE
jgi:putative membrane protein